MEMPPAAEWSELYNRFYRKVELYLMSWKGIDLSMHKIACAPFGGPIAMIRDDKKLVLLGTVGVTHPALCIYGSSGKLLASVPWLRGRLVTLGWVNGDVLLCVLEDGVVLRYDVHGKLLSPSQFSMGAECAEQGVVDALIVANCMVCRTASHALFAVTDLDEPRPTKLAPLPGGVASGGGIQCMAVIPPAQSLSGTIEVLVAAGSSVYAVDAAMCQDQHASLGHVLSIVPSPDGAFLACFTADGKLHVTSSDFSKSLSELDSKAEDPPTQLLWCGQDSVVLYWSEALLVVGPFGDWLRFAYDEHVHLAAEVDGVRVLGPHASEFLQRVPDSVVDVFKVGSTAPGALLYDALEHFDKRSAKADESLRAVGSALPSAVQTCMEAAGHEFDAVRQRTLLRAAAYGHAFCSSFPKDAFREMCQVIRVLNAVRHFEIGVPISYRQYQVLGAAGLVDRLIHLHEHFLALRIADYLGLGQERVLTHWACAKISATLGAPDMQVRDELASKVRGCRGFSFAKVASHALQHGRPRLAAMLLDFELRAREQVPLLTSMDDTDRALSRAIDSGDPDLVYHVLFHILEQKPMPEFIRAVQAKPLARDLYIAFIRKVDPDQLKAFYKATEAPQAAAELALEEAAEEGARAVQMRQEGNIVASDVHIQHRQKLLKVAGELFLLAGRDYAFQAKMVEEQFRLLRWVPEQAGLVASWGPCGWVSCGFLFTATTST
eukprot:jgi/Mesvir1/10827/Mv07754-RA.2